MASKSESVLDIAKRSSQRSDVSVPSLNLSSATGAASDRNRSPYPPALTARGPVDPPNGWCFQLYSKASVTCLPQNFCEEQRRPILAGGNTRSSGRDTLGCQLAVSHCFDANVGHDSSYLLHLAGAGEET
jgi:hypothetical protein